MAKSKASATKPVAQTKDSEKYYVWVEFYPPYFQNRNKIEASAKRESHGSGCGFGLCDCSWHNLDKATAEDIKKRVQRLKCVTSVKVSLQTD